MAEPLKAVYNESFLRELGGRVRGAYGLFDTEGFAAAVLADDWEALELKARMRRISKTLGEFLPDRYEDALDVLLAIGDSCTGFPYLIFPDFVEVYGTDDRHWELSMRALERFTAGSSAEFAVRPFLLRDPERAMARMTAWTESADEHVRRLASEGCRPRLPWGQALPMFKRDPAPVLALLERLKADPSLYVRKSVANNLNDIAKDHPELVLDTARRWKGGHPHTDWIVRHGCRTLVRRADPAVMALFGYADEPADAAPLAAEAALAAAPSAFRIGDACRLSYRLRVREEGPVRVRVEYAVDFVKSSGRTSRKAFLLADRTVPGGSVLEGERVHSWADLTTRKHYPGPHRIALLVNGREAAFAETELLPAQAGGEREEEPDGGRAREGDA